MYWIVILKNYWTNVNLEYDWYIKYLPNFILILVLCNGNDNCCTSSNQCDIGEGDCDQDLDCIGNLFCGKDNCVGDTFEEDDDCCTDSSQLKIKLVYRTLHHLVIYVKLQKVQKKLLQLAI